MALHPWQRGDVVWMTMTRVSGHEQRAAGRHSWSARPYNKQSGAGDRMPHHWPRSKGIPSRCRFPEGLPVRGVILSDQAK